MGEPRVPPLNPSDSKCWNGGYEWVKLYHICCAERLASLGIMVAPPQPPFNPSIPCCGDAGGVSGELSSVAVSP